MTISKGPGLVTVIFYMPSTLREPAILWGKGILIILTFLKMSQGI